MLEKCRGVVLQQIKYTDSGIIVRVFTREEGGISVLIKGMRRKKSGKQPVFFQPLYILDMELYNRQTDGLCLLKEFVPVFMPLGFGEDIRKTCVALFLGEILSAVIRDEQPNPPLFDYLEQSVRYFNDRCEPFSNFHLSFLSGLCGYLGFGPRLREGDDDMFFDMVNGRFMVMPPPHGGYADVGVSGLLARFFAATFDEANMIPLNGKQRNDVLDALLKYYSVHTQLMKKINSIDVMKEIFS